MGRPKPLLDKMQENSSWDQPKLYFHDVVNKVYRATRSSGLVKFKIFGELPSDIPEHVVSRIMENDIYNAQFSDRFELHMQRRILNAVCLKLTLELMKFDAILNSQAISESSSGPGQESTSITRCKGFQATSDPCEGPNENK